MDNADARIKAWAAKWAEAQHKMAKVHARHMDFEGEMTLYIEGLGDPMEGKTPAERAQAFRDWANSHKTGAPPLSDYAVSREAIYSDEDWRIDEAEACEWIEDDDDATR